MYQIIKPDSVAQYNAMRVAATLHPLVTLVFIAPWQVMGVQPKTKTFEAKGRGMLFHPDLIKGTPQALKNT